MNRNTQTQTIIAPFVPDEGLPYIFISYAHTDRDRVFPIIKRIYENGWRVWYDEGLELGNDYYDSLKKHIYDCAVFLLFASENALNSHFITTCEVPQAYEFNKKIVVLFLDKDCKIDMPELRDATYTDDGQVEAALNEIKFLHKVQPRKAVGHQIRTNILKRIRDSKFDYVKCAGGIRITKIENDDATIHIPNVYPPFSNLNVIDLDYHYIFWNHTNLEEVYLPDNLRSIDLATFLNNKHLKNIYIPKNITVTNKHGIDLSAAPYALHCANGSLAHKFAKELGIKFVIENDLGADECLNLTPYAYISISYFGESKSFPIIMELSEHRCNYTLGGMGRPSKKKIQESIQNCACFVAFIDKQYVQSNVIDDLRTAISLGKKIAIYQIEECDLPEDLADLQAIHQLRYNTGTEQERTVKLINWLTENKCRDSYDFDGFEYEANDDGISLTKYVGRCVNPRIEPFFCGVPVTYVGGFQNCDFVRSVSIPEGVEKIGYGAFLGCKNLRNVDIPSTVMSIGPSAFKDCIRLERLDIPKTVTSIGNGAFSGCRKLKAVSLPNNTPLATGVYYGWPNLKVVKIPENEYEISNSAFRDCEGLKSVVMHDKVTRIGYGAFSGCTKLMDINISENVTEIGANAFSGCREIKKIVLPTSLKIVCGKAFEGCDNLEKVVFCGMDTKVMMLKSDLKSIPIFCKKGSWIQLHCDKWGVPYTLLDL